MEMTEAELKELYHVRSLEHFGSIRWKDSLVKKKEIEKIFKSNSTKEKRWRVFVHLLLKRLSNENPIDVVCNLIKEPDSSFRIYAIHWAIHRWKKERKKILDPTIRIGEELDNPYYLCFIFLDWFVQEKYLFGKITDIESFMAEVMKRVGLLALNIDTFRQIVTDYSYDPNSYDKLIEVISVLTPTNRKQITQQKYWLMFVMVEKLKSKFGLRGSIKEVARLLNCSPGYVNPRYCEKKKVAMKNYLLSNSNTSKFDLDAIIKEHALHIPLRKYLKD